MKFKQKEKFTIYLSKNNNTNVSAPNGVMNLLLITDAASKSHYVYIKDFNKFMYNQTKHKAKKYFCMSCLQCFSSEIFLKNHQEMS